MGAVEPAMQEDAIVAAAQALAPGLRERSASIEQERRLPADVVAAFAGAGLFRMGVPRTLGGAEAAPATMIRVIEAIARGDGSAGWCVMIGATTGIVSAYLPEPAAREIYGAASTMVTGGVFAPMGRAVAVDGGYRVSGRWSFASGCEHCAWLMGGCVVLEDGKPRLLPTGMPDVRLMLFPATAAQVIDTWSVSGLRGTGSHDIAVDELFVAQKRAVSLITDRPQQVGALYAFPVFGLLALGIAGVALGIARTAIDELTHLAGAQTPTGSRRRLADRALVQAHVAQAEASVRAARAFLFETVDEAWTGALASGATSVEQRALLRLAATHATTNAARAVDLMYTAGGGSAIYAASPLQRCFRDVHVATQHMMVAEPTYELTGRVFLGLEVDTSVL